MSAVTPPGDDLDAIMAVMAAAFDPAFGEAWSRRQVGDALVAGNCHYRLAGVDGGWPAAGAACVGFALLRTAFDEEELLLFAVMPEWRRRGIGRRLLDACVERARARGVRRMVLEMRDGNPAGGVYRAAGFVPVGRRPQYYRGGDGGRIDAVTLARQIA